MKRAIFILSVLAQASFAKPDAGVVSTTPSWLGSEMPLALAVRTPEDLAFKAATERQYLFFNLLASGKVAWDTGQFDVAATRWENLLRTPNVPFELEALVKPLAKAARDRAGSPNASLAALPVVEWSQTVAPTAANAVEKPVVNANINVVGLIGGGGSHGPGGAVIVLRRAEGTTPKPKAARVKAVVQKNKAFMPHVLAVPLGSTVEFRNDDEIFHNVFSLSKPNAFDLGLYKNGVMKEQSFASPGPVHLLCNIHASMNGWIFVSDSPWYGQSDASGKFTVRNVPPGQYEVEVWHEWSTKSVKQIVRVNYGMPELALSVDGEKLAPAFTPDKSGKPRQSQLGY
jgi:plastocyanin